ncbi:prepilin-type N-terminal cleavage/methylation domain-containing protein [Propionivibrio limicola]|uniref:prepilin-type N-terminal cleavage/methylation domain-containing protein n=1 Tax=Propionivibrio limicola TaxID=167645 RepID=UPI001B86D169|nr:prepilin-type N-terminal cleavage/methylation domain-containing protein [Propionivibrio limicola]
MTGQRSRQRGVTLVELIVAMVVISVGLAGILLAFNVSVRGSADPMVERQLVSIAEALMEEVQQAAFTYCDPDDAKAETATGPGDCATTPEAMGPEAGDARPFDNVNDYNGLALAAITDVAGVAVPYLGGYSASVAVAPVVLNTITEASGNALRISVTATGPGGQSFTLEGYRARYAPNDIP